MADKDQQIYRSSHNQLFVVNTKIQAISITPSWRQISHEAIDNIIEAYPTFRDKIPKMCNEVGKGTLDYAI